MQRITDINTTLLSKDKSWRFSLQTAVTPQSQANNPLSIIGEDPAFIVDVVNQKKTPVYSDDKNTIVLVSHVVTEEERRAYELRSRIPLAISNMLDPWINASDPYGKLLFSKNEFLRSSKELANFLNEYTEKFGTDAEFLERCNSLLDDLKKKDPNGENKINSHIQDLLKKAMRGQKVPVDQEKAEVLFNDVFADRIKELEDKDTARLDRQQEKVKRLNQERQKQIDVLKEKLKELYKKIEDITRGNDPSEYKNRQTTMIQKEIDAISEQLSKIHMIKFEDIMRASNF